MAKAVIAWSRPQRLPIRYSHPTCRPGGGQASSGQSTPSAWRIIWPPVMVEHHRALCGAAGRAASSASLPVWIVVPGSGDMGPYGACWPAFFQPGVPQRSFAAVGPCAPRTLERRRS